MPLVLYRNVYSVCCELGETKKEREIDEKNHVGREITCDIHNSLQFSIFKAIVTLCRP